MAIQTSLYKLNEALNQLMILSALTSKSVSTFGELIDNAWFVGLHSNGTVDTGNLYIKEGVNKVLIISLTERKIYKGGCPDNAPVIELTDPSMEFVELSEIENHSCNGSCNHNHDDDGITEFELGHDEVPEMD